MDNSGIKILLVDDEEDTLEFISYNLEQEGFQTACASDGIEAIKLARSFQPDLIILDVMMPNMDELKFAVNYVNFLNSNKLSLLF